VSHEQQLAWERLRAPAAAASAFAALVLQLASFAIQIPALSDAPATDDPLRYRQTLLNFNDHSGVLLASGVVGALGTFAAAGALYYLFRATRHRRRELPGFVQWLLAIAPVLLAVAVVANWVGLKDASDRYTEPGAVATLERSDLSSDDRADIRRSCRRAPQAAACTAVRIQQEATAKKQVEDARGVAGTAAGFAGTLAIAFAYVIVSLNAMRAGLLSRFMGVLGIGVGVLIVLPLLPQGLPIVQMFWIGALGALFLGRWAGGRGPAWESGEPDPWPTAADRRAEHEGPPEPEPVEEEPVVRRSSRKRRKKKR
jgi:hypothetical protein